MSDERIKKDVVDQLYWDNRIDASDITVSVSQGQVTLEGKVPTYGIRQTAGTDCFTVFGVTSVVNNLMVAPLEKRTGPSDDEIRINIKSLLMWNPDVDATDLDISVVSGLVTLEGAVDAFWKKIRAEELTGTLLGVVKIINDIAVVPTEGVVDKVIAKDISAALDRHADIHPDSMNVEVADGVVSLSGTVSSWGEYRAVEDTARYSPGVVGVENQLVIA